MDTLNIGHHQGISNKRLGEQDHDEEDMMADMMNQPIPSMMSIAGDIGNGTNLSNKFEMLDQSVISTMNVSKMGHQF